MGLDQYAYACDHRHVGEAEVDFAEKIPDTQQFHYWRKHPDLQGWMRQLYLQKGGKDESFNCVPVRLNMDDLDLLESAVKRYELPHTTGFFFGQSDDRDRDGDLEFIEKARKLLAQGKVVYYTSWW